MTSALFQSASQHLKEIKLQGCSISSCKSCRKHFRASWAWVRLEEEQTQAWGELLDAEPFVCVLREGLPWPGAPAPMCVCQWGHWQVALAPAHSIWESNLSLVKEGSADQSLLYGIFAAWVDPLACGSMPWAHPQCSGLFVLHKHKILLWALQSALVFMWLYLQQGRENHLHPPDLGTFFQSRVTFGSRVFGAVMFWEQPLTLSSGLVWIQTSGNLPVLHSQTRQVKA